MNFTFDDSWEVYQLDSEVDYEKVKRAVPETKCIDFIAFRESDSCLLFVEVKGFRGHATTENLARLRGTQDDLTVEIAQKVRDSLAVLTGGARNSTNKLQTWKKNMIHLTQNGHLKIVAWVELDVSTETKLQRSKVNLFTKSKQLKKRLIWLTSDVRVLNTRNYHNEIPGMSIQLAGDNA